MKDSGQTLFGKARLHPNKDMGVPQCKNNVEIVWTHYLKSVQTVWTKCRNRVWRQHYTSVNSGRKPCKAHFRQCGNCGSNVKSVWNCEKKAMTTVTIVWKRCEHSKKGGMCGNCVNTFKAETLKQCGCRVETLWIHWFKVLTLYTRPTRFNATSYNTDYIPSISLFIICEDGHPYRPAEKQKRHLKKNHWHYFLLSLSSIYLSLSQKCNGPTRQYCDESGKYLQHLQHKEF